MTVIKIGSPDIPVHTLESKTKETELPKLIKQMSSISEIKQYAVKLIKENGTGLIGDEFDKRMRLRFQDVNLSDNRLTDYYLYAQAESLYKEDNDSILKGLSADDLTGLMKLALNQKEYSSYFYANVKNPEIFTTENSDMTLLIRLFSNVIIKEIKARL